MAETIVMFGATSQVGKVVATCLAKCYDVRIVTRDVTSATAEALCNAGCNVVRGDVNNAQSIADALKGAYGCFIITHTDHQSPDGFDVEVKQGKNIADACLEAAVKHVVQITKLSVVKALGIRSRHMDAKAAIELYMKDIGLPWTGVIVPTLYEHFLQPPLRPQRIDGNNYEILIPLGNVSLDFMSVEDVGEVVRHVFKNKQQYNNKTLSLSAEKLTIKELAATLTRSLHPRHFKDKQITVQQYRELRIPENEDFAHMFDFYMRVDQRCSIDLTKKINPGLQSLAGWLDRNERVVKEAMDYQEAAIQDPWA